MLAERECGAAIGIPSGRERGQRGSHVIARTFNREQGLNLMIVTHEFDFATETSRITSMPDGRGDNHHHRGAWAPDGERWPDRVGQGRSQALEPPTE